MAVCTSETSSFVRNFCQSMQANREKFSLFTETRSDVFSVDVAQMEFKRIFYRSDDSITAIDLDPSRRNLICCANHSGRVFIYDFGRKTQLVENRLRLQRRKSSTSDTDIIETPHVTALAYSPDGHHLLCGLANGAIIALDPTILFELAHYKLNRDPIAAIKFSHDSSFVTVYVSSLTKFYSKFIKFPVRRTKNSQSLCCITRSQPATAGRFWEKSDFIKSQSVMFCSFHRRRNALTFPTNTKLSHD